MDWIVACITIASMELIARKRWQGWLLGLVNQAFWTYLLIYEKQLYGLLIIPVILTWRYSVALMKWKREA